MRRRSASCADTARMLTAARSASSRSNNALKRLEAERDRKSTRLNSSHTVIYTLSLHDALPIYAAAFGFLRRHRPHADGGALGLQSLQQRVEATGGRARSEEHTSELQSHSDLHSFPTRRSSDLCGGVRLPAPTPPAC